MNFYEMDIAILLGMKRGRYRDLPHNVNEKMRRRKWMNNDVKKKKDNSLL